MAMNTYIKYISKKAFECTDGMYYFYENFPVTFLTLIMFCYFQTVSLNIRSKGASFNSNSGHL